MRIKGYSVKNYVAKINIFYICQIFLDIFGNVQIKL